MYSLIQNLSLCSLNRKFIYAEFTCARQKQIKTSFYLLLCSLNRKFAKETN